MNFWPIVQHCTIFWFVIIHIPVEGCVGDSIIVLPLLMTLDMTYKWPLGGDMGQVMVQVKAGDVNIT